MYGDLGSGAFDMLFHQLVNLIELQWAAHRVAWNSYMAYADR